MGLSTTNRKCQQCGVDISHRYGNAKFCSNECCLIAQSERRKAERKAVLLPLKCRECGRLFYYRFARKLYCSVECKRKHKARESKRRGREAGVPCDNVEKECPVCGSTFTTNRAFQIYCSKQCRGHVLNGRRIDKQRKTNEETRVSPELVYRRAKAVRQHWTEGERLRHDGLVPEMPILPKPPAISQAERVRSHLETGNTYGALKISAGWPKLGDVRAEVETAWRAYQHPDLFDDPGAVVRAGLAALKSYLKVGPEHVQARV